MREVFSECRITLTGSVRIRLQLYPYISLIDSIYYSYIDREIKRLFIGTKITISRRLHKDTVIHCSFRKTSESLRGIMANALLHVMS